MKKFSYLIENKKENNKKKEQISLNSLIFKLQIKFKRKILKNLHKNSVHEINNLRDKK